MSLLDTINGKNLKSVFGTYISDGTVTLLNYPKFKEPTQNNWPDEDGVEVDLDAPRFDARTPKLKFTLSAGSKADFKQYYYGLFNEFRQPGGFELYVDDISQTFYLYYLEMTSLKKLSKAFTANHIGVEFEISFGERDPYQNIPGVYLVDEFQNFIIG